jgi:hypothetical protein
MSELAVTFSGDLQVICSRVRIKQGPKPCNHMTRGCHLEGTVIVALVFAVWIRNMLKHNKSPI